jgi:hypothetical protein
MQLPVATMQSYTGFLPHSSRHILALDNKKAVLLANTALFASFLTQQTKRCAIENRHDDKRYPKEQNTKNHVTPLLNCVYLSTGRYFV